MEEIELNQNSPANNHPTVAFYGSRLFLKFFLWFWSAVVLTGVLVTVFSYFYHFLPENNRILKIGREIIEEHGQMVVEAYENGGAEAARKIRLPGYFWLFDKDLSNILSSSQFEGWNKKRYSETLHKKFKQRFVGIEAEIASLARKILNEKNSEVEELAGEQVIGCRIVSETGNTYVIINHIPSKTYRHKRFLLEKLAEALPVFLLVTAFFCFALARYMVKPIAELRRASRKFASGDLSARADNGAQLRMDELGDLAVDFNEMAAKIEKLIHAQRRLFGDISHELRSPLARMQIALELLHKKVPAEDSAMCSRIEKELLRMNGLIEEILQFSRLESGNYGGEKHGLNFSALLKRVCNDAEFEGRKKGCRVVLQALPDMEISGIEKLLERAIENLLRNAVKYSPEGAEVNVCMSREVGNMVVSIRDSGPGIAEAELEKVFSPFYRCNEDRNRSSGGTGLGLAIARRAINLHGGTITLENLAEDGLQAKIILPL